MIPLPSVHLARRRASTLLLFKPATAHVHFTCRHVPYCTYRRWSRWNAPVLSLVYFSCWVRTFIRYRLRDVTASLCQFPSPAHLPYRVHPYDLSRS